MRWSLMVNTRDELYVTRNKSGMTRCGEAGFEHRDSALLSECIDSKSLLLSDYTNFKA